MITISPLTHRGEQMIRIDFERNSAVYTTLRKLPTIKYSATHRCWYIAYHPLAYESLKATGLPICISDPKADSSPFSAHQTIRQNNLTNPTESSLASSEISAHTEHLIYPTGEENKNDYRGSIEITYQDQRFYITLQYLAKDIQFLKSLAGSYWNIHQKKWVVRANPAHLQALQEHFAYWPKEDYDKIVHLIHTALDPMIVELYTTPEYPDCFMVKLKGYRPDYSFLKTISGRNYDKTDRRWILPFSPDIIKRVVDHYTLLLAKVINRLPVADAAYYTEAINNRNKQTALLQKFPAIQFDILKKYTNTLIRQKYSWSTVTAYLGPFSRYIDHIQPALADQAAATDVNDYLSEMAAGQVSDSVLNTTINAVKFYYEKVVFRADFKINQIKRPRKGRYLPTILSISEVDRILRGTDNVKHATILYTFYGSGIRLNELLSLKVHDIWWDRNQLLVKHGKGGKDRVVMLSETLKQLLKKYFDEYMPQYWLFEGQDRHHKYSEKSVQQVVKQAASRVGITKKVTPHTLRHCFATHLMDNGVQLPYIQELLGHKDIKTTLIYTHVTTKNVTSVVSPLDQLRMLRS